MKKVLKFVRGKQKSLEEPRKPDPPPPPPKEDTLSFVSSSDLSIISSSSPHSNQIPPPCKPLRSLEYLQQEPFPKSELVTLGSLRTRHISFTETPSISSPRLQETTESWGSERNIRHFKRYSLDFNRTIQKVITEKPEVLESYDEALKLLEKCDLDVIKKSRSLPRTVSVPSPEFKQNSLPRSLTTEFRMEKKPMVKLKHLYRNNLKRGRKLVKSWSFSRTRLSSMDQIRGANMNEGDGSKESQIPNSSTISKDTKNDKNAAEANASSCPKWNGTAGSSCAKRIKSSPPSGTSKDKDVQEEVIRWKKQYDDVLKKLEVLDGDTKAMGRLLTSTELAKYLPKADANDASHGQTELAEVISVLKSQYDKVENVLTKQFDKLETIVDKLELDGAKKKDLVQVVKVGDTKENKITILVENDQMGEVVDLLKSCLLEKNIEMNVVVKVGKGQNVEECLASLERENGILTDRTQENQTTHKIFATKPDPIYERLIQDYEATIRNQEKEIQDLKKSRAEYSELLKNVTSEKLRWIEEIKNRELEMEKTIIELQSKNGYEAEIKAKHEQEMKVLAAALVEKTNELDAIRKTQEYENKCQMDLVLEKIRTESQDLKATLMTLLKKGLMDGKEGQAVKSQVILKVQSLPELSGSEGKVSDQKVAIIKSKVSLRVKYDSAPNVHVFDNSASNSEFLIELKYPANVQYLDNSAQTEILQEPHDDLIPEDSFTRRETRSFEIAVPDFRVSPNQRLDVHIETPTVSKLTLQNNQSEVIMTSVTLNEPTTELVTQDMVQNAVSSGSGASNIEDPGKEPIDEAIKRIYGEVQSIKVLMDQQTSETDTNFHEILMEVKRKLEQLQMRMSEESIRNRGLETQVHDLENKLEKHKKINHQDCFELTRAKIEKEILEVQARLQPTIVSSTPKSSPICKNCMGVINRENAKSKLKKSCNCPSSDKYKRQLNEAIHKQTAGGPQNIQR